MICLECCFSEVVEFQDLFLFVMDREQKFWTV